MSPFQRSLSMESDTSLDWDNTPSTPKNTVAFPLDALHTPPPTHRRSESEATPRKKRKELDSIGRNEGARTLSEILRKHADREFAMDQEEATRIGDVLRGWINSSLSPYEADDDTFTSFASRIAHKDDLCIPSSTKRKDDDAKKGSWGRARGMSESARSSSSIGSTA